MPPSRSMDLKRENVRRVQRSGESARAFADCLEMLMRRYVKMTNEEQLGQLFYNLAKDYWRYIRHRSVRMMTELLVLSDQYKWLIAVRTKRLDS
ncbi:hypothetical protein KM043_018240 [Ampulex compressa]|nr:hypothetical protein KM043_018240 [Ampulex compressa]